MRRHWQVTSIAASLLAVAHVAPSRSGVSAEKLHEVTVVATDYAFGVPTVIPHGLTAFAFDNRGKQRHQLALTRLRPGVTADSALRASQGSARLTLLDPSSEGILIAEPGDRSVDRLLINLAAGSTYLLICTFRDAPDKPQHTALGMFASFRVQ